MADSGDDDEKRETRAITRMSRLEYIYLPQSAMRHLVFDRERSEKKLKAGKKDSRKEGFFFLSHKKGLSIDKRGMRPLKDKEKKAPRRSEGTIYLFNPLAWL